MAHHRLGVLTRHVRRLIGLRDGLDTTDDALLERFTTRQDEDAFADLVQRHGPLVLGVCRRILGNAQDAEDAFQATFLILACKAGTIRRGAALGGWLSEVAYHVAVKARALAARRPPLLAPPATAADPDPPAEAARREVFALLDEELRQVPEKYRGALVLCYLQGKTHEEAARELGWPLGSVAGRLERGRDLLRQRLQRRGVALSAPALAALLSEGALAAAVPAALAGPTTRAATLFAAGNAAGVPGASVRLAEGALRGMSLARAKGAAAALAVLLVAAGTAVGMLWHPDPQGKPDPARGAAVQGEKQPGTLVPAVLDDWPLFRGDARRVAHGKPAAPGAEVLWRESLFGTEDGRDDFGARRAAKGSVEASLAQQGRLNRPLVPGFFPLAVNGRLVYRAHDRVTAVDLGPRTLAWRSLPLDLSLMGTLRNRHGTEVGERLGGYQRAQEPGVVLENTAAGTLSSDGERVYALDTLAVPGLPGPAPRRGSLEELDRLGILQAYSLRTGKLVWRVGEPLEGDAFRGSAFLGPPLPVDGALYLLNEKDGGLRLVCLDPLRARSRWTTALAPASKPLDPRRRLQAVQPAYSDGMLVCPTHDGSVFGIDVRRAKVVWKHVYREGRAPAGVLPWWRASAPLLHDGKVICAPPDTDELRCLDLYTGQLLWKAARGGDLYVGGVLAGRVLLVGDGTCRALSLADGREAWKVRTGTPSGVGVASGDRYYLPVAAGAVSLRPEVCVLDARRGQVVARHVLMEPAGNLLFHGGLMVSQTATDIAVYAPPPKLE
jgi:RNA polymerase sigma factor (sigma-70 family)